MKSPIILAATLLASPAMAGQSEIPLSVYRPNPQFEFALSQCRMQVTWLTNLMQQLKAKA